MPEAPPSRSGSVLVAAGILLSRLAGLVRERAIAHYLGAGLHADVLRAALRIPNLLQNLLGEGTLSASFVPVYSELLAKGKKEEAGRVAGVILALLATAAGALSLVGVLLAPLVVVLLVPGFTGERFDLCVQSVRLLFPMTGLLVVSAWALGVQNSHRAFFGSYAAPVAWNVAIVAALVFAGWGAGEDAGDRLLFAASLGALIGGAMQLGVQLPAVRRLEPNLSLGFDTTLPEVREVLRNAGPAVWGRGVVQLSAYVDQVLASLLTLGSVAAIGYAQVLYLLPVSLFGMSIAAAELPDMARERGALDALRTRVGAAQSRVLFFVVPSAAAFLVLGDAIVGAVFRTGQFGAKEQTVVWAVLAGYSVGLVPTTVSRIWSSALYALRDTRTPARTATIRVVFSSALGFVLMTAFEPIDTFHGVGGWLAFADGPKLGAAGLALAAGVSAWGEATMLARALNRAIALPAPAYAAAIFGGAAVSAAVGRVVFTIVPHVHPIVDAVVACGAFGVVYLGITGAAGVPEVRGLLRRLKR